MFAAIGGAIWSTDFSGIPLQREAHTKRLIEAVRSPATSSDASSDVACARFGQSEPQGRFVGRVREPNRQRSDAR
jgi:hypothetical protein